MGDMLLVLDEAYGHPVDMEFTAHFTEKQEIGVNLLQCRSLRLPGELGAVEVPASLPRERVLFRSSQSVNGGAVCGIKYILYVDPAAYDKEASLDTKQQLGRIIGRLNQLPDVIDNKIILMGPGRWGSTNILLGINVGYSDISHASVLAEVANEETGHVPEVSFGTHFFQDLVESQIIYAAVFPDQTESQFNQAFFACSPNALTQLLPGASDFAPIVHVIDVPKATNGLSACIAADPLSRQAVCYLA
jgi:hypothetical protein